MNYVNPLRDDLSATDNDVTYSVGYYKAPTLLTGVTDEAHLDYNQATAYVVNDYCIVPELKKIYKATTSTTGEYPPAYSDKWQDWGAINSYRMLSADEHIGSKTTGTDIVLELDFSRQDAFSLVDCLFTSVQVELIDDDDSSVVFDETISGADFGAHSFAEYFYTDKVTKTRLFVDGLEWLPNSTLRLTFSGYVEIGALVYGSSVELGCTLYGTSLRFEDTSNIIKSEVTGYRTVYRYGNVKVATVKVIIDAIDFNTVAQKIESIISKNILFVPTDLDRFSEMISIGYFEDFELPIANPMKIETQSTIIGVI